MPLSIGIVGLPNVGKSSLFNLLTEKGVEAANYPFCTIDPNVGVVKVPDERLNVLAKISQPEKVIPAVIEFVDIAGLVKGASQGEGLGNQFLSHIRECDAICEVVRDFEDKNVIHVAGKIDPKEDEETIALELVLADLASATKKLEKTTREAKTGDKAALKLKEVLERVVKVLEDGKSVRTMDLSDDEKLIIKDLNLLTIKPLMYLLNTNKEHSDDSFSWDAEIVKINVKLEEEIASLPIEEQAEYLKELGIEKSGLDKLVARAYKLLGLETFFTTGKDETRAWTIKSGSKAPQAAGVIHTDFEKGFIRAEVIKFSDFVASGSEVVAREKGLLKTEGKEYIVKDGDICNFLVNR